MKKVTLFKFRSLGNSNSLDRAIEIVQKRKFFCSKLWDQNDPMEGIYLECGMGPDFKASFFSAKNSYVICAFSGQRAYDSPTMWGYYANGFKGIAVETEVAKSRVTKMDYQIEVSELGSLLRGDLDAKVRKVLQTKLNSWEIEDEYRYFRKARKGHYKVGEIKAIHFGWPYGDVGNWRSIKYESDQLRSYIQNIKTLADEAKKANIHCYFATIEGPNVKRGEFDVRMIED